jgi:hypothetical protein
VQNQCSFRCHLAQAPWGATLAMLHNHTCKHGNPEARNQPTPTQVAEAPASTTPTTIVTTTVHVQGGVASPSLPINPACQSSNYVVPILVRHPLVLYTLNTSQGQTDKPECAKPMQFQKSPCASAMGRNTCHAPQPHLQTRKSGSKGPTHTNTSS